MLIPILLTLLSFLILFVGAELLVRGGAGLALRLGLSSLVIGLTVVAYGTSAPEFIVSLKAALKGQSGIAVGNVIGSNIFNIAVILGLAALVKPIGANTQVLHWDGPFLLGATILTALTMIDGTITRWEGMLLFAASAFYTIGTIRIAKKGPNDEDDVIKPASLLKGVLFVVGGLLILILGSRLLVENAVLIARTWGVSETVIGLTIIAAGTSMPELATSVVAALRSQSDISLGNVVGSNIFNLLFVLGAASLVHPITVQGITKIDFIALFAFTIVLLPFLWTGKKLSRPEAIIFLAGYAFYLAFLWPQ